MKGEIEVVEEKGVAGEIKVIGALETEAGVEEVALSTTVKPGPKPKKGLWLLCPTLNRSLG